jgi:glycosyltransferase involved in cell wall biosynthesis
MQPSRAKKIVTTARCYLHKARENSGVAGIRSSRLTVCQVLHSLNVGGAEVLAARLVRQLTDSIRFLFICLDELGTLGEQLRQEGFPVEVLTRKPGLDLGVARRLAALWRRHRVDAVHAHQYTPFFYAMLARLVYRRPPILFTEHGRHYPDYPRRKRMLVNRLLLQGRDRIVGVGQAVCQALIDNEGIPAGRVSLVYNGIDIGSYASSALSRPAVRRELKLGADDLVLIQVARLDYLKDHATALQTLSNVLPERPDAHLLLVGAGPERPAIEKKVRELGLGAHVHLLGLRGDIDRLLSAADIFLLTSISEGIPLTIIEAMAAGLPVISTRVGGVPEMVDEGHTGLLAGAGDAAGLARAVLQLAADPPLRRRMGEAARAASSARFSGAAMYAAYERLYREMCFAKQRHLGSVPADLRRRLGTASVELSAPGAPPLEPA